MPWWNVDALVFQVFFVTEYPINKVSTKEKNFVIKAQSDNKFYDFKNQV